MKRENPFSPAFPCNPKIFVNRKEELNSFERAFFRSAKITFPTPDNILILGNWGLGKSSLLRKFESIAIEKSNSQNVFSSIVELMPSCCGSMYNLKTKIIDDLESNFFAVEKILPELRAKVREWKFSSGQSLNLNGRKGVHIGSIETKNIHQKNLKEVLIDLWSILEDEGIEIALLMIDDIHYLAENFPDGIYELLNTFKNLPKYGCNFMLCITSAPDILTEEKFLENFRFFSISHKLRNFTLNETKEAILKPIELLGTETEISDQVIEKIYELTQGHPFFINFIMRELMSFAYSEKVSLVSLEYFDRKYPLLKEMINNEKFQIDFYSASAKERRILINAAKLSEKFSPSEIPIKDARTQLRFLLRKNLIVRHSRGEYSLYHPLFKEYLLDISGEHI